MKRRISSLIAVTLIGSVAGLAATSCGAMDGVTVGGSMDGDVNENVQEDVLPEKEVPTASEIVEELKEDDEFFVDVVVGVSQNVKSDADFIDLVKGDPGESGSAGAKGETGEQGIPGEKGEQGAPGSLTDEHSELLGLENDDHPQYVMHDEPDSVSADMLIDGSVEDAKIASVSASKIAPQGSGSGLDCDTVDGLHANELVGDGSGFINDVLAGSGLEREEDGAVVTISVGTGTITTTHLAGNSVTSSEIASNAVTLVKIDTTGAAENDVITFMNGSVTWAPQGGGSAPTIEFAEALDSMQLTTAWQTAIQVTVNAPTSGKVHVVANASINIGAGVGNPAFLGVALTDGGTPVNIVARVDHLNADLGSTFAATTQYVGSVSAGLQTFYLVASRIDTQGGTISVSRTQISATFCPE